VTGTSNDWTQWHSHTVRYHHCPVSLHFNGHFPGESGLAVVYWSKGWRRWWWQLDQWSCKPCKAPVKSSPPTNQHRVFLQAGCPSCRQTNSVKAMKGKYHIPWTCLPQAHLGVFQLCLWPLIAPGYLGGGLSCLSSAMPLISPLMPVPTVLSTRNQSWPFTVNQNIFLYVSVFFVHIHVVLKNITVYCDVISAINFE